MEYVIDLKELTTSKQTFFRFKKTKIIYVNKIILIN